jgi:hypothetical protein
MYPNETSTQISGLSAARPTAFVALSQTASVCVFRQEVPSLIGLTDRTFVCGEFTFATPVIAAAAEAAYIANPIAGITANRTGGTIQLIIDTAIAWPTYSTSTAPTQVIFSPDFGGEQIESVRAYQLAIYDNIALPPAGPPPGSPQVVLGTDSLQTFPNATLPEGYLSCFSAVFENRPQSLGTPAPFFTPSWGSVNGPSGHVISGIIVLQAADLSDAAFSVSATNAEFRIGAAPVSLSQTASYFGNPWSAISSAFLVAYNFSLRQVVPVSRRRGSAVLIKTLRDRNLLK